VYRYGFNGKENDNEVKGDGNQYDYGFRIYDPRLGRFLSTDPLAKKYPFYSPYQFAGNDVIRCIDLDGLEPTAPVNGWKDKAYVEGGKSIDVYDKTTSTVYEAHGIIDPWTGTPFIVADDGQQQNKYFYLVDDKGAATNKLQFYVENGRNVLYKQHLERFETRNETDAKQGAAFDRGFSTVVFGAAIGILAAPVVTEGASLLPSLGEASLGARAVNLGVDYGSQVAGNYIGGKSGSNAWVNNINITSLGLSAFNPASGIKSLAFNSIAGSTLSSSFGEGYNGLGGGKSLKTVTKESVVFFIAGSLTLGAGVRINQITGRLTHVNNLLGPSAPLSKTIQSTINKTAATGAAIGATSGSAANGITQ